MRACILGLVLNTTAFHERLTNCSIVSACISDDARVPYAFCLRVVPRIIVARKPSMALLSSRAIKCPLAEFLYSNISMYPPAGSSIDTVSDNVSRLYSTGTSCHTTLPFPWFMGDGLKSSMVLSPHWLSVSISNVAPVRVRSHRLGL